MVERRLVTSLVIVGDEVLSGKVVEQNAAFLIKRLRELGARVREVCFVEDEIEAIAEAIARNRARADRVIVTGGIGPTHDDVTIQAAARALGVEVHEDEALLSQIAELGKAGTRRGSASVAELSQGERRLARVPRGACLEWGRAGVPWPVTRVENLWFFPGVPPLLQALFEGVVHHFSGSPPIFSEVLELDTDEATICEALDAIVAAHDQVAIGSYPRREAGAWQLKLTFESHDRAATEAALAAARNAFAAYSRGG